MSKFRKKPVVVEAVQFTEELRDSILFDGQPLPDGVQRGATTLHPPTRKVWSASFYIETLEGRMSVSVGDWIITGVKGEHYACKPDVFAATYEPAEAAPELLEALREIADDYADRFDLDDPSTNPGIKYTIKQARAAIAKATGQEGGAA